MRMQSRTRSLRAGGVAVAVMAIVSIAYLDARPGAWPQRADVPAESETSGGAFTADVSITQRYVDGEGRRLPAAPPALTFRLERSFAPAGWTTALTLTGIERPAVHSMTGARPLEHPFLIARMVHDEKNGLRLFNARGERVRGPDASDRQLLTGVGGSPAPQGWDGPSRAARARAATPAGIAWAEHLMVVRSRHAERRLALERDFGASIGRVGGFDRYLSVHTDGADELLVDPEMAVPVEINTVRGGELVARTRFGYEARGTGLLVRRRTHAERVLAEMKGRRLVTDIEVTNLNVTEGGAR